MFVENLLSLKQNEFSRKEFANLLKCGKRGLIIIANIVLTEINRLLTQSTEDVEYADCTSAGS